MSSRNLLNPCKCGGQARIVREHDRDECFWLRVRCNACRKTSRGKWASSSADACPIFYAEVRDEWNQAHSADEKTSPASRASVLPDRLRRAFSDIEDAVAGGELSAAQVFTRMRGAIRGFLPAAPQAPESNVDLERLAEVLDEWLEMHRTYVKADDIERWTYPPDVERLREQLRETEISSAGGRNG